MTEPTITQNCALYFALHRGTRRRGVHPRVDRLRNLRTPTIGQSPTGLGLHLGDGKGIYRSIGRQLMQIKLGPLFERGH